MEQSKGMAVATLIFGIASVAMVLTISGAVVGLGLAIVGVVLGNQVKKEDPSNRMAKAGRVLCWIVLILFILFLVLMFVACVMSINLV